MSDDAKTVNHKQLTEQVRCDPDVFVRLYRQNYDGVFRYCVHRLFDRTAAEDVTATVFLKALENLSRFRGDEGAFRGWLYKVATNTINSHLRASAKREKLLKAMATRANPGENDPIDRQKLVLLQQAMFSLKVRYQTIITLRFFENMKLTDIAGILGSSPATVRSQLARALAKLRKKIIALEKHAWPEVP